MRTGLIALAGAACLFGATTAQAQDPARYQLERSGDGYVRLDKFTGEMSFCEEKAKRIVCHMAADERDALIDEIARLQERMRTIETRLAALEGAPSAPVTSLPTDEEFEKTMGYMERFFRRFMGVVKDLERDFGSPGEVAPEKS